MSARVWATVLADHFGSLKAMLEADEEELAEVNEIGPIIAKSVHEFLHSRTGRGTIDELTELGLKTTWPKAKVAAAATTGPLAGRRWL